MDLVIPIIVGVVMAATPLLLAAVGELVVERSGVLNLGVEGMMVMGAFAGFAATIASGSPTVGVLAAAAAGAAMASLFALLTLVFLANQVASGLALTLFGLGLSALLGQSYTGKTVATFPRLDIPVVSKLPVIGPLLFSYDALVYLALALTMLTSLFLFRTRWGLILRAVGENHDAAHALGYPVVLVRATAIAFGGACAGVAGAYLSLVQTPLWAEKMTAGRGWIALALVVFASWRPARALVGAYLFGGVTILQLHAQGHGLHIDPQILSMLPYIATILVLVAISRDKMRAQLDAPACLGKPFFAPS